LSVQREGGCACGAVRYRLASEPLFIHCCHCLNCQRQTGSAFVINLLIEADRVELVAGEPQPVDVPRDDGSAQRIFRCQKCQVAVYSQYGRPEVQFVRGGTLDRPSDVTPDVHIFTKSKLPWISLPEGVPAFEIYYDTKALWPPASLERLEAILAPADPGGVSTTSQHSDPRPPIEEVKTVDIETPHGLARAYLHLPREPRAALALGYGAGGSVASEDLVAVKDVALAQRVSVALIEQPYRVAGRRSPAPARQLDAAWMAAIEYLSGRELARLPLLVGGRSLGARVACRTAHETGTVAVLCLAFPLHAPGRSGGASRLDELEAVTVPTLVVQGDRDPFGMPPAGAHRSVVRVPGTHSLKTGLDAVGAAVGPWLADFLAEHLAA